MKSRHDPSTQKYYKCFSCPDFRKTCGGMPTREMDLKSWCEYILDVMDFAHLTSAYVAKEADVSAKTMERISAGNDTQDFMRGTTRRVELVVLGPVGRHTCQADQAGVEQLRKEAEFWKGMVEELREENARKAKIIDKFLEK